MDSRSGTKRLFLAIPAPQALQTAAQQLQAELDDTAAIRWIPSQNLHITQFFFGKVQLEMLPNLIEMLRIVLRQTPQFELVFDQFCYAPRKREARMIWARYRKSDEFRELHQRISLLFQQISPELQQRKSPIPHVTLARMKQHPNLPSLPAYSSHLNMPLHVQQIACWSSDLQPQGAVYQEEALFQLAPSPTFT